MGYGLETGLPDDFDMEITNAHYAFNARLAGPGGEPRVALHLEGKVEGGTYNSPEVLADDGALLFSTGDKWMVVDDGQRVVHESGQDRGWNVNSAMGRLQQSAIDANVPLRNRGDAQEAKIWTGLKVHFKRKPVKFGGEIGDKQVLFIEKYLGEAEGGAKKSAPVAKPAAAETSTGDGSDDQALVESAVGGAIFKRLQKLAAASDDYDSFASEATELPKIKDDDNLQDIILDDDRGRALYEALKG